MINPLAIALALAFWAPYTPTHEPPCTQAQVEASIHYYGPYTPLPDFALRAGFTFYNSRAFTGESTGCDGPIYVGDEQPDTPVEAQCALIAHELGHRDFDLPHSLDPSNIMFRDPPTPGVCYGKQKRHVPRTRRHPDPWRSEHLQNAVR